MSNFYILYGEDKGIIKKELENLEKKLNILENDIIFYEIEDIQNIVEDASTVGLFSSTKFIIINATVFLSGKKSVDDVEMLEDYIKHYNKDSYLMFISYSNSIDNRKKIVKLISDVGVVKKVEATVDYLTKYASDYLKKENYKISNYDLDYFVNRCGNNVDNITNELDKLMMHCYEKKEITKDIIDLLVEENIDNTVFDLVGAILKDDGKKAMKLYNKFILDGMDPNQIVAIIASQIRTLFQVKRLYNKGMSNDEIAKFLEFRSVYRVKYLLSDCYYYSEDDLIKYLLKLADIDKAIKIDGQDGNMLLELFIAKKDM